MAWVEVHQSLREHRKLYSCADDLDIEPVLLLGMLVSLWLWALDNTPDGGLDNISNRTIARATRWPEKKADQLMTALINNGWVDRTEERVRRKAYGTPRHGPRKKAPQEYGRAKEFQWNSFGRKPE